MQEELLGHQVRFEIADLPAGAAAPSLLESKFRTMVAVINAASDQWSSEQADCFRLIDRLVVFRKNIYDGLHMTRSYMAQKERTFYWVDTEYIQWEPEPRRATAYFHDAWHVMQYLRLGKPPNDEDILIDREQDAMREQLLVAHILKCDATMLADLEDYKRNRERIRQRLSEGVGFAEGLMPHLLIMD